MFTDGLSITAFPRRTAGQACVYLSGFNLDTAVQLCFEIMGTASSFRWHVFPQEVRTAVAGDSSHHGLSGLIY